ncbi:MULTISPECIES: NUDIX hydrolase [Megasphaera]|uniref:NUDIX domain protein n=1 Tax=Megasphaera vaginalis (ex Srinivasan et al. 2021) TaxID=1111454 RepID=U7UFF4_9FIRM|nr:MULTISPECIES: NUDIX hydrolase [Megasphaera]ERT57168.1 NUDIX domain protein [Megasphaera vaginalis (ex Srinivasan et al. 2021)]
MSISTETLIARKEIMKGRVLHVTLDTVSINGGERTATREAVWHHGACAVLPIRDDGKIIFVRQYRYATGVAMLEIPAGKIERDGEAPELCAARELEEEAGVTGEITPLGFIYTSPGFCNEKLYLYVAQNLKKGSQHLDDDEFLNIEVYTPQEVETMIERNEIVDAKTLAAFAKARKYLTFR